MFSALIVMETSFRLKMLQTGQTRLKSLYSDMVASYCALFSHSDMHSYLSIPAWHISFFQLTIRPVIFFTAHTYSFLLDRKLQSN